jgi:hypothetical protein
MLLTGQLHALGAHHGAGSSPASATFCLSGPVQPLRLVVCVMPSLPSARLSPEGSRLLSYLPICIACCRTCLHSRYVRHAHRPSGACPHLSIWLAAPRGVAGVYVSLCFGPIRLSPVTCLLVKAVCVIHLSMVLLPPLCLPCAPITKCMSSYKASFSTSMHERATSVLIFRPQSPKPNDQSWEHLPGAFTHY